MKKIITVCIVIAFIGYTVANIFDDIANMPPRACPVEMDAELKIELCPEGE